MTKSIEELCGIADLTLTPVVKRKWLPVTVVFRGTENYVLRTKRSELSLTTRSGGFGLEFRKPLEVPAEQLLGKYADTGQLVDIVVEFAEDTALPPLSLATLERGRYPRVLRRGEVVHVG